MARRTLAERFDIRASSFAISQSECQIRNSANKLIFTRGHSSPTFAGGCRNGMRRPESGHQVLVHSCQKGVRPSRRSVIRHAGTSADGGCWPRSIPKQYPEERHMKKASISFVIASAMLAAGSTAVFAQASGAVGTGPATISPGMTGPTTGSPGVRPSTTGSSQINTSGVNQPGVPNTSTPGTIGTGASPSGLPGDSATSPGYPSGSTGTR